MATLYNVAICFYENACVSIAPFHWENHKL